MYPSYCFLHSAVISAASRDDVQSSGSSLSCGFSGIYLDGTDGWSWFGSWQLACFHDIEVRVPPHGHEPIQSVAGDTTGLGNGWLVLLAVLNSGRKSSSSKPDDGVWWVESHGGLATRVLPDSPGQLAGVQKDDLLTAVNDVPVTRISDRQELYLHTGVYGKANYSVTRAGQPLDTPVVIDPSPLTAVPILVCASSGSFTSSSASTSSSVAGPRRARHISTSSASSRLR